MQSRWCLHGLRRGQNHSSIRVAADAAGGAVRGACATSSDQHAQGRRQSGRRFFSPVSAQRPTSPRAPPLPRASSRPAGSRLWIREGFTDPAIARRRVQDLRRGDWPVCARQDKVYAAQAVAAAAKALKAAGAKPYLSGRPAGRTGSSPSRRRSWRFHLRRRRCAGDALQEAWRRRRVEHDSGDKQTGV